MAKVNAPLLSFGARGQIGKAVVFAKWRGVDYARQRVIPANPQTIAQEETRGVFRVQSQLWTLAPEAWKAVWNLFAQGRPFTGRNRFIGDNVRMMRGEEDRDKFVFSPGARGGIPPEAASISGGVQQAVATLTNPDAPPGWSLVAAIGVAVMDGDPAVSYTGPVGFERETVDPSSVTVTGLTDAGDYAVGVFLEWEKPNGDTAYSVALTDTVTVTES